MNLFASLQRMSRPALAAVIALFALTLGATAGSLTPSALPAATMHSLANIYDSIASAAFDSSAIIANQNGSLLANLKYIENQIVWASGSSNIWSLNSGNVGIGTTSPEQRLEVGGNILASTSGNVDLVLKSTSNQDASFTLRALSTGAGLSILGSASQAFMTIASSGNVGIGTTSPGAKLNISDGGLLINDLSTPTVVASFSQANVLQSQILGNYAYIAGGTSFVIADVSNPASPVTVSTMAIVPTDFSFCIQVVGHYAYVCNGDSGLNIYDITKPSAPVLVSTFSPGAGFVNNMEVVGKYAYLSTNTRFLIVDVSNPASPVLVAIYAFDGANNGVRDIFISGHYAYVTRNRSSGTVSVISILDITDPYHPRAMSHYAIPTTTENFDGIYVSGRYAYVTVSSVGLKTFNISNPASISHTATLALTTSTIATGLLRVTVDGRYAYVSGGTGGIKIVDISDPTSPTLAATLNTGGATADVFVSGKYAYASNYSAGRFEIVDLKGIDTYAAHIGSLQSSNIRVTGNVDIANRLSVNSGLSIGGGGILTDGPINITLASLSSNIASVSSEPLLNITSVRGLLRGNAINVNLAASGTAAQATGNFAAFQIVGTSRIILGSSGEILASGAAQFGSAGVPSSVSYSRFGIGSTGRGLSAASDLLISGMLEVDGQVFVDSSASISSNLELTSGYASLSNTLWVSPPGYAGNVGVGTTAPLERLHIRNVGTSSQVDGLRVASAKTTATTAIDGVLLDLQGPTQGDSIVAINFGLQPIAANLTDTDFSQLAQMRMQQVPGGGGHLQFLTKNDELDPLSIRMHIDRGGNVGIGTTSPGGLFDIASPSLNLFRVLKSGNVGIGTTGPTALLEISKSSASFAALRLTNTNANAGDTQYISFSNSAIADFARISGTADSVTAGHLFFSTKGSGVLNARLTIDSAGNVGIGDTTPTTTLDVAGSASVSSNLELTSGYASLSNTLWVSPPGYAGNVGVGTRSPVFNIDTGSTTGSARIGQGELGAWPAGTTHAFFGHEGLDHTGTGNYALLQLSTGQTLLNSVTGQQLNFRINNADKMVILPSGNIGIGTTTAAYRLNVNGGIAQTGSISYVGYLQVNSNGLVSTTNLNAGISLTAGSSHGLDLGYNSTTARYRVRAFSPTTSDFSFATVISGFPTSQSDFTEHFVIRGDSGNLGIGSIAPEQKLEVAGNILASASAASVGLILNNLSEDDAKFTIQSTGTTGSIARLDILGSASQTFMSIASSGNIGINTVTPVQKLQVAGDIRVGTGTTGCVEDADGTVISGTCSSDERLKKDIIPITNILSRLSLLQPSTYRWRSDEFPERHWGTQVQLGLIAQQVAPSMPELIATASDGFLQVRYNDLPLYLLSGIRELASRAFQLDELLAPRDSHLEPSSSALARLVHNILAYIAEVLGIELLQDTVKADRLCAGDVCVNERQLQQLLNTVGGLPTGQAGLPTGQAGTPVPSDIPVGTTEPSPTPSDSPVPTPTETPMPVPDISPPVIPMETTAGP